MLYLTLSLAFATCPLKESPSPNIVEITSSELPTIKENALGCTTLIELWASWCKPCRDLKMPLQDLLSKYPEVHRVPLSADYTAGALRSYLKKQHKMFQGHHRLSFWSIDGLQKDYAKVGAKFEGAIPFLLLFSKEGELLYSVTEPKDLSKLEETLSAHLKEMKP